MTTEAQHMVLAGTLQRPTRTTIIADLDPEFFSGKTRTMFVFIAGYFKKRDRRNALDLALARSRLERSDKRDLVDVLLTLVDEYDAYDPVSDAEFRDAIEELAKERREKLIQDHASEAVEAMVDGKYDRAAEAFRAGLLAIEDAEVDAEAPMDIRSPAAVLEARKELRRKKNPDQTESFNLGFGFISKRVSFRRKELTIFGGFSADGKTQVSRTLAYNAAMNDGADILWVSLEMSREEMQTLFVTAHAATLDPRGVDYRMILEKEATKQDRLLYDRALADFMVDDNGMETRQGSRIEIWSPPKDITFDQYRDRARATKQEKGLDILVGDYLELIIPTAPTGQYRLDLKNMVQASKSLARELEVWHLVLHQISRKGRADAEKREPRHYVMSDLGESAGMERAADTILWSYYDEELKQDRHCKIGIAKARKGDTHVYGRHCYANFARGIVAEIDDEDL